jgi:tetratricopeptide (TPR) repeat protein
VGLGALVERAWSGIASVLRAPTAAELFRRADRMRHEGRHDGAAELVAEGLRRSPGSPAGHILDAYLRLAAREIEPARDAFKRVLTLDPDHPRALLGLARIAIEEGNIEACRRYLGRALEYHPDFPEARALQEMVGSWSTRSPGTPPLPAIAGDAVALPPGARDLILTQADGRVLLARCEGDRQPVLGRRLTQVARVAGATLARAGLGPLRRGALEGRVETMLVRCDAGTLLSVALPASVELRTALTELDRLRAETAQACPALDD